MNDDAQLWMKISEQDLLNGIIQRTDCTEHVAKKLLDKIKNLNPSLRPDFMAFWNTGNLSCKIEIEGYSINSLVNEMKMKPIGAFTTLDWLIEEPSKALEALKRGYDRVIVKNDK